MKKITTAFIFCFLSGECFSQAGEWVWIKGDSIPNQPGNFGLLGVPSPTNNPPSLYEPCEWTDMNGNFWLFGGVVAGGQSNALWKYDPITNEWTWMKGPSIYNDTGNYGTQGIPNSTNLPSARGFGVASWTDSFGNLWLFGGNQLSDLWRYNISANEWTWMNGPTIYGQPGVYGTMGVPNAANYPRGRYETSATWTDNNGNLWIFGGLSAVMSPVGNLNDLCRYNIATNMWTWMKGSSGVNQPAVYGTLSQEDTLNTPGGRGSYSTWKDSIGNLWLFGGGEVATNYQYLKKNDLWRFNPISNNWAWMNGSQFNNDSGSFGTPCFRDDIQLPSSRLESRTRWVDSENNFWLFGGIHRTMTNSKGLNDLWKFCVSTNKWRLINGDSIANSHSHWGSMGVPSPANKPKGKLGAVGWKNAQGSFYVFGGSIGYNVVSYNDLWKYTIDTTCGVCPAPNSVQENNPHKTDELLVFPNPTNASLTISFQSIENQSIELRLYNTLSKQFYFSKEEIVKGKYEEEINVEKYSDGIYFLQVKTKERNISRKVIINH